MLDGEAKVGEAHFHFAGDVVHGVLIAHQALPPDQEQELVAQIDQEVVSSYLPEDIREDFLLTVYRAAEVSAYSDVIAFEEDFEEEDLFDEDEDEDEDEDTGEFN